MPEAPPAKEGSTSSLPLIVPFRTTVPTREPVPTANSMRMRAATCFVGRGLDEETRGQEADVKRSVSTFGAYVITDCFRDVCVFVVCCRRSKILRKPMPSTKEKRRQQQRARREKLFLAQRRHLTSCSFTWHELVSADGKLVSEGRRRAARQLAQVWSAMLYSRTAGGGVCRGKHNKAAVSVAVGRVRRHVEVRLSLQYRVCCLSPHEKYVMYETMSHSHYWGVVGVQPGFAQLHPIVSRNSGCTLCDDSP